MAKKETNVNTNTKVKEVVKTKQIDFIFGKRNYQLLFIGLALILLGFILMSGGAPSDPNKFDYDEIFSARRITIAPVLVLMGFVVQVFAIMHKSKD